MSSNIRRILLKLLPPVTRLVAFIKKLVRLIKAQVVRKVKTPLSNEPVKVKSPKSSRGLTLVPPERINILLGLIKLGQFADFTFRADFSNSPPPFLHIAIFRGFLDYSTTVPLI